MRSSIIKRISFLTQYEGITITSLERQIGASKGVLSRAFNKNTDIQSKWLTNIVDNYPHYKSKWILSGLGNMLEWSKKTSYKDGNDEIAKRLSLYFASKGISIADANQKCGWSRGNLQQRLDKKKIEGDHLFLIVQTFTDLNPQWLMIGDGEMLKETVHQDQNSAGVSIDKYKQLTEEKNIIQKENEAFKQQIIQLKQDKQNQQILINLLQKQPITAK